MNWSCGFPLSSGNRSAIGLVAGTLVLVVAACAPTERTVDEAGEHQMEISSTAPRDLPRSSTLEELAVFAWQEFLALSWKSAIDPGESPVGKRGVPDAGWSYSDRGAFPELMTWQTWAQTTELRPNGPLTIPWDELGTPVYSYSQPPAAGSGNPSFTLWNNLDEDNEIGSCDIYGQYDHQSIPRQLVVYQVKVNKDEYEYIRTNYGRDQNQCAEIDSDCPQANKKGEGGRLYKAQTRVKNYLNQIVNGVIDPTKNPSHSYYRGAGQSADAVCDCPPDLAICLPCGGAPNPSGGTYEGAIEVKSAWRKLLPGVDDHSRYYTTEALYYDTDSNGDLVYLNDTFALIGMHIIHKTQNFPDFVFATFEQIDVESTGMKYAILYRDHERLPALAIQRQSGQSNRTQNHPVPPTLDAVTRRVHQQLTTMNPDTIWQYYRLTGVQGASVDCPPSPDTGLKKPIADCVTNQDPVTCTDLDPNYFMANFVIESDPFLNNFSGPGAGSNPFGNCRNTVYNNQIFDNGGCKGCHGVAQTSSGTDFSFLLDFGNNKPAVRPAPITNPSNDPASATSPLPSLTRYVDDIDLPALVAARGGG